MTHSRLRLQSHLSSATFRRLLPNFCACIWTLQPNVAVVTVKAPPLLTGRLLPFCLKKTFPKLKKNKNLSLVYSSFSNRRFSSKRVGGGGASGRTASSRAGHASSPLLPIFPHNAVCLALY